MRIKGLKRLKVLACMFTCGLLLTGCAEMKDLMDNLDNPETAFSQVRERNIEYIELMNEQGFLTDKQKEEWITHVTKRVDELKAAVMTNSGVQSSFLKAITPETRTELAELGYGGGKVNYAWLDGSIHNTPDTNINGNVGECGADHDGSSQEAGVFYQESSCPVADKDKNGDGVNDPCGNTCYVPITYDKFNHVANTAQGSSSSFVGDAFELYDAAQVDYMRDALERPVYIITKFDQQHTPEKLQAIMAILNEDREAAQRIIDKFDLSEEPIGTNRLGELAITPKLTDKNIANLEKVLIEYCEPAKDANGNSVPYLRVDRYQPGQERSKEEEENGVKYKVPYIFADTQPPDQYAKIGAGMEYEGTENELGTDLMLSANSHVALKVRLMEFNPELIETLREQQRISDDNQSRGKYYVLQNSENYVIKMDYPLYKIDSINIPSNASKDWNVGIADTELFMDISDGAIYDKNNNRMEYSTEFYTSESCRFWGYNYVDMKDPNSEKVTMTDPHTGVEIKVHPLVLLDYVETYYVKDGEKSLSVHDTNDAHEYWLPLGRRMRISKLSGGAKDIDTFAQSLEFDGGYPANPHYISLEEVSDRTSGYDFYEDVNERLGLGVDNDEEVKNALNGDRSNPLKDNLSMQLANTSGLGFAKDVMFTYINPTICIGQTQELDDNDKFQMPAVAQKDHSRVYKDLSAPTIYGMCLSTKLTDSDMVGGTWIGGSVDESIGLTKWNNWLRDNHFTYYIDIDKILELLGIVINLQEEGNTAIVFDPGTIEVINKEIEGDTGDRLERTIRTVSRLFGVLLLSYAALLVGAWIFDTNMFGGIKMLTLLTFGHWIAVQDKSEVGGYAGEEKHYMDLRDMIVQMFIITAIGCILLFIDFFDFREIAMKYIEPLTDTIKNLLTGG